MAHYHIKPTTGNDANDGLTPATAKKTINAFLSAALLTANDIVFLYKEADDFNLTANISMPSSIITNWRSATNDLVTINCGTYSFGLSNTLHKFSKIKINSSNVTACITQGNGGSRLHMEDCEIWGNGSNSWISGAGSDGVFNRCLFKNAGHSTNSAFNMTGDYNFLNCKLDTNTNKSTTSAGSALSSPGNLIFTGCEIKGFAFYLYTTTNSFTANIYFNYCTLDGSNGFSAGVNSWLLHYRVATAGTVDLQLRINNCLLYNFAKIINKTGANGPTDLGLYVRNNWISSTTDLTNYVSSGGDITSSSDPLFYTDAYSNYRLEPNSSAAIGLNGLGESMGANELADPADFYTDLTTDKVKNGENYKVRSRTNNRVGALVGGGETNTEYILSNAPNLPGLINPNTVMASNVRGTLPLNKVAPSNGGTMDLPSLVNIAPDDTLEGVAGTMDLPNLNKVAPSATLRGNNGTMDLPSISNVRDNDTLEGVAGQLSSNDLIEGAGGNYKEAHAPDVREGVEFGVGLEGELSVEDEANLPAENNVVAGTPNYGPNLDKVPSADVDILANLPSNIFVLEGSGNYGKDENIVPMYAPDFPDREDVAPDATVNGESGTMDLPSIDKVSPNATLRGVVGEQDLPDLSSIKEDDTLEGVAGLIPLAKLPPSQGGSYVGEESNDDLAPEKVENLLPYLNLGQAKIGALVGGSVDPKFVMYPYGTLGLINEVNGDVVKQLEDNAKQFMQGLLGDEWQELKYFKDPEKNDSYNNKKAFGIRGTWDQLTNEKIGKDTLDVEFEIKLTTDFTNQDDDLEERNAERELIEKMELIRRQLRLTKFYKADIVRITRDWNREETEKIGNNVVLCRGTIVVNIDVKNG